MGLNRRLKRLEAAQKQEQAQLGREALTYLSDEDLYRVSSEQSRRAVDAYLECVEAIREGREPNVPTEIGEEEIRETRNGYRIWKYRK